MAADKSTAREGTDPARAAETGAAGEFAAPPPRAGQQEMAAAPDVRTNSEVPQGQWSAAWREFRKRTGAVIALCVIFLLITLAIFAPLLANDKPLVYHGANRFVYSEAARSIRAMLSNAARAAEQIPSHLTASLEALRQMENVPTDLVRTIEQAAETAKQSVPTNLDELRSRLESFGNAREEAGLNEAEQEYITTAYEKLDLAADEAQAYKIAAESIPEQFNRMIRLVVPQAGEELANLRDRAAEAMTGKIDAPTAEELRKDIGRYPADVVYFEARWEFPVFASLNGRAMGFLVLNILVILALLAKLIIRRRWSSAARRRLGWGIVLIPLIVGIAWAMIVPSGLDRTPYKQGIPADQAGNHEGVAPVLYTFAIWPPIPYGLDEVNLDTPLARPAILGPDPTQEDQSEGAETKIEAELDAAPHWLGTDTIGRDTLARMLWGARVSLAVGILAVAIYVAIGIVVGAVAGYYRGWVDMILSRIIEVVLVFPAFFLILTIVAFLGPSLWNIMVVIGLTGWTRVARLVRGEFFRLADQDFVIAGRALGYTPARLIFRHILPNALAPVLVAATFGVAGAILIESALSFLGIGISIPTPSWGNILADGRDYKKMAPWLIYIPGMAIFITILCYNLAGEALRDALDPRLRGSR